MTADFTNQVAAGLLLLSLFSVLAMGMLATFLVVIYVRSRRAAADSLSLEAHPLSMTPRYRPSIFDNPCRWAVIRSRNLAAVQSALRLHNPIRCSFGEGLSKLINHKLFISPPIRGWILVIGQGLPDPSDDVDECFHFVSKLSLSFGHVQFFSTNRALNHHAWVRADAGRICRAYAWAGETLWNQGALTAAERDLGLRCYAYGETSGPLEPNPSPVSTTDKVLFLAARWSLDPSTIDESLLHVGLGVAGDLIHSRQH